MIRYYTLFCKLFSLKKSSLELYAEKAATPAVHSIVCPGCCSKGNCAVHSSYKRTLIDIKDGKVVYDRVEIKRVRCKSRGHTHAILPDYIVPYTTYSLLFILRVLCTHFLGLETVEQLCLRYHISPSMLYQWKALFLEHKKIWLGVLENDRTAPGRFIQQLRSWPSYSEDFGRQFYQKAARSFLQRHRDAARSRHAVF